MAKRRIVLTSQEMNEINTRTKTLETQLQRSNARIDELEDGLGDIRKLVQKKSKPKKIEDLCEAICDLVKLTLIPPVTAPSNPHPKMVAEVDD